MRSVSLKKNIASLTVHVPESLDDILVSRNTYHPGRWRPYTSHMIANGFTEYIPKDKNLNFFFFQHRCYSPNPLLFLPLFLPRQYLTTLRSSLRSILSFRCDFVLDALDGAECVVVLFGAVCGCFLWCGCFLFCSFSLCSGFNWCFLRWSAMCEFPFFQFRLFFLQSGDCDLCPYVWYPNHLRRSSTIGTYGS